MIVRNTIGVITGLATAMTLILLGITANKAWFDELDYIDLEKKGDVFLYWADVIKHAPDNFFIALLISCGIGSMIGGVVTALIVKRARQAYAIFIGLILFLAAVVDILLVANHPTWYEISLFFVFFPFSWLGGKIVDLLMRKRIIPADR